MAVFVSPEQFADVDAKAGEVLEVARALGVTTAVVPADVTPEQRALFEETTGLGLAVMALAHVSPLEAGAVVVALGHAVSTIIAQSSENHAELYRLLRAQMKQSYDDVMETARPKGSC